MLAGAGEMTSGMRLALESGIGHQREYVRFWSRVLEEPSKRPRRRVSD